MEIVEHTSNILTLKAKAGPWSSLGLKVGLPFGAVFFLAGLTVVLLIGKKATLNCDRIKPTQITCDLTSSGLLSHNVKSIEQLKGAELEVSSGSDSETYRVAPIAESGKIPLTDVYSSGGSSSTNVALINDFVNNPAKNNIKIKEDHRWFAYPFGGIFMLCGGWIFFHLGGRKTLMSCTLNKTYGQASLKLENIFGKSEIREEQLENIQMAQIDKSLKVNGQNYGIELMLKSGKSIYLGLFKNRYELAEAINQFLDVNEQ